MIHNRDYTLIIDQSGSMSTPDQTEGRTRWQEAQSATLALAEVCEQYDPDGITLYTFSSRFKRYPQVTTAKVAEIFNENQPLGSTNLVAVLQDALEHYFQGKAAGIAKPEGEIFLIITDGEPNDQQAVIDLIIQTTQRLERSKEIGLSFIQVGDDPDATAFLETLDDKLHEAGAKYDICDTVTIESMANMSLTDVLLNAVNNS